MTAPDDGVGVGNINGRGNINGGDDEPACLHKIMLYIKWLDIFKWDLRLTNFYELELTGRLQQLILVFVVVMQVYMENIIK